MAQIKITINVSVSMGPVLRVTRYLEKNRSTLLLAAAMEHSRFIRNRYTRNIGGRGPWKKLKRTTVRIKEKLGVPNPPGILKRTGQLKESIGYKKENQGYRSGFIKQGKWPGGHTLLGLITLHAAGRKASENKKGKRTGEMAKRVIVYPLSPRAEKTVLKRTKEAYNKLIREKRKQ